MAMRFQRRGPFRSRNLNIADREATFVSPEARERRLV